MAALSLILALSALWTGPIWGQDRSWAGSIDPTHALTSPTQAAPMRQHPPALHHVPAPPGP